MKNKIHSAACIEAHVGMSKDEGFTCTDNCPTIQQNKDCYKCQSGWCQGHGPLKTTAKVRRTPTKGERG